MEITTIKKSSFTMNNQPSDQCDILWKAKTRFKDYKYMCCHILWRGTNLSGHLMEYIS